MERNHAEYNVFFSSECLVRRKHSCFDSEKKKGRSREIGEEDGRSKAAGKGATENSKMRVGKRGDSIIKQSLQLLEEKGRKTTIDNSKKRIEHMGKGCRESSQIFSSNADQERIAH